MIPDEGKEEIIRTGINFMRSITEFYGVEDGMKVWDNITQNLDPDIKGQMFFAMIGGSYAPDVVITGYKPYSDRVSRIKTLRVITVPSLGLKEAKDLDDELMSGRHIRLEMKNLKREIYKLELQNAGYIF